MAKATQPTSHDVFVGIAFELIGVAALAVFADMNDNVGELLVVVMIGWFIIFLAVNASWLQTVIPGAKITSTNLYQQSAAQAASVQKRLG